LGRSVAARFPANGLADRAPPTSAVRDTSLTLPSTPPQRSARAHRHFSFLTAEQVDELFFRPPEEFTGESDPALLAHVLGATLYSPANHPALGERIRAAGSRGITSTVACLEDAIADRDVDSALETMADELARLDGAAEALPLVFVRARNPAHLDAVIDRLGPTAGMVNGYVAPKFSAATADAWLAAVDRVAARTPHPVYLMPVLESSEVLHVETRRDELQAIAARLDERRDRVLAVRTGVADLCGLLGLRRSPFETVYRISAVRDCIADIVNVFARAERRYVVSGGVWEYFQRDERLFRPELRQSMFDDDGTMRDHLMDRHFDGLMAEIESDLANGLTGKSVVHPMHVGVVNALHTVPHEAWIDAGSVLAGSGGGATASQFRNKMNEAGPHRLWAERITLRARAFGVLRPGVSVVRLLEVAQVA
jgi:citrate lyase beta subunit